MNGHFFFWSLTEWMEWTQCWFVPLSANTMLRSLLVAKVLGLSWIAAGSVMMERLQPQTSSLRKTRDTFHSWKSLLPSFSGLGKKLRVTVTQRFTLSWKSDWAPI